MPTATKTQKKAATFISSDNNLRLVRIAKQRRMNDRQEWETTTGHTVEFNEGRYSSRDKDVLEFLREHPQNGVLFVEQGKEPGRALPDVDTLLEQIVDAVADKDEKALASIYLQERNTHSRDEVLKAAARGLEKLDKEVPAPDPTPEHQVERIRQTGPPLPGDESPKAATGAKDEK